MLIAERRLVGTAQAVAKIVRQARLVLRSPASPMSLDDPDGLLVARLSTTEWRIADVVSKNAAISLERAIEVVATVFDVVAGALASGERVEVRGFGTFAVRHYEAYRGRNPRTGEPVDVRPKRKPVFKTAKELRLRLQEEATPRQHPGHQQAPGGGEPPENTTS